MNEGVFTNDLRVTFVEKSGSEVGSGTLFPLLITGASAKEKYDKLAELLARVRRSKFSGAVMAEYSFATISLEFTADDPPADNYSGTDADCVIQQAYADTESPPANATRESQIWTGPLSAPDGHTVVGSLSFGRWVSDHSLITGFTHYAESYAITSGYYPYGLQGTTEYRAAVELGFSGEIAWVDTNASGNILDPMNELYVGLNFNAFTWDLVKLDGSGFDLGMVSVDAYTELRGNPNEGIAGTLTFELSTGDLTCDVYLENQATLTGYDCTLKITPVEWWPYAKDSPAVPVWNTATGAKL